MEIRLHGRGGQGGVTCAKILAACYARLGKSVQTFGDYAGERSGAPVRAYTRVSDEPIINRNKVYHPDHLVVLDPHLLGPDTLAGLVAGGTLTLNTPDSIGRFANRYRAHRLAVVDATEIARRHGIGSRSVVIVNTTLAGAFARAHDLPFEVLEEAYRSLGLLGNLPAAREAYDTVQIRPAGDLFDEATPEAEPAAAEVVPVEPLTEHLSSPPTGLKTGSWSSQRPSYVQNLAPCNAWCPAGNDVVTFVQAAHEDEAGASAVLGLTTPLAAVCGRVCPAPCMEGCNRAEYDGAVNIRSLERWIADRVPVARKSSPTLPHPFRVAVAGGGPAGIAAAYELAQHGHRVTIYDAEFKLGGVLTTGIPAYRLPRRVVESEIADVLALGVETRLGVKLDSMDLVKLARDHDGLILATGLQCLRKLDVPGVELEGVHQGIRFLHRVNLEGGVKLSGRVLVLGGGNTAVDCARSALRAGAEQVVIAYRRTRSEMPAIREEVDQALQEGVELRYRSQPLAFEGDGRVQRVRFAEVEMGEPDDTGRRTPIVTDRTFHLEADTVLLALGQSRDLSLLPRSWEIRDARVWQEGAPLNVVTAGDFATGDGTVTHAIGSGRRAAGLTLKMLGIEVEVFERPDRERAVPVTDIRVDHFERLQAAQDRLLPIPVRRRSFDEANLGIENALESHRCFSCGHCTSCDTCLVYCPEGVVRRAEDDYKVDYTYCKGCGICVEECPRSAMEMSTG